MHIAANNVSLALTDDDVKSISKIVGGGDDKNLTKTACSALHHILSVCSTSSEEAPVLMDIHVFLASKLLEDASAPVDREAINTVLEAWREAESQLHPDARKALRLLEPVVMAVFHAKDKPGFMTSFNDQFVPKLPLKAASFLRTYVEVMQQWAEAGEVSNEGHYLENVVSGIYQNALGTLGSRKKSDHVRKRLAAAKEALDSYLFE